MRGFRLSEIVPQICDSNGVRRNDTQSLPRPGTLHVEHIQTQTSSRLNAALCLSRCTRSVCWTALVASFARRRHRALVETSPTGRIVGPGQRSPGRFAFHHWSQFQNSQFCLLLSAPLDSQMVVGRFLRISTTVGAHEARIDVGKKGPGRCRANRVRCSETVMLSSHGMACGDARDEIGAETGSAWLEGSGVAHTTSEKKLCRLRGHLDWQDHTEG